jgi:hypothetical protein
MKPHRYYGTDFAKKRTRSIAGKRANKAGASFEERLNAKHDEYRVDGLAIVEQLHKATGGFGASMYIKGKAPIDFAGNLCSARAVYIEAKSTALLESGNPSGTLGINHSRLKPEQVVELVDRARMGCLCLVLWWNGVQCGVFRVTPEWFDAGVGTGIAADRFEWLPKGSIDWLSVVPNHPTGLAALAVNKERMLAGMETEKLKHQIRMLGGVV